MNPSHLLKVAGLTFALFAVSAARGQNKADPPAPEPKPATLPLTRVVLFNAGVGYFHREGRVDGDAKLELRFPEADINDLIKSLVLIDRDGGKVKPITYDNRAPVEFTLRSFALDLTDNPTVGQLMHQARGEKVEVSDKAGVVTSGKIVSVENPIVIAGQPHPGELLHVLTADGLQTIEIRQSKKIRFVRAELQAEFHKALDILASAKGDSKKAVSVVFAGQGNRRVGVGYVTEAPLWKPTYRLTVDEKGAARLQGWAAIENTTDEDWVNVKVGLVAGRPMSFQMDLYDPLFIPRPIVESDLFASLRPPLYQGGLNPTPNNMAAGRGRNPAAGGELAQNQGFGGFGGFGGGALGGNLGIQGGQFGSLGGQFGFQGYSQNGYVPRVPRQSVRDLFGERLSHDDYVKRLKGQPVERPNAEEQKPRVTVKDHLDPNGGVLAAAGGGLGDMFEYKIEEPVSLGRQKSALLPIANEPVEGAKVSIYNAKTLGKHPLLGLKLVNKTKLHLAQGPITVYEADTFAGDARLPDLKPGETRLISYAIDLGTEVVESFPLTNSTLVSTKVAAGRLDIATREQRTSKYLIRNRNPQDRAVVVEHPVTANWKLTAPEKPADRSRDFYRFELTAKAGDLTPLTVTEEHDSTTWVALEKVSDDDILRYSKSDIVKPAVKDVLAKVLELRNKVGAAEKEQAGELAALKEIGEEQDRIRKNIERVPPTSEAYKRYLKKFDDQETEIEKRQAKVKELKAEAAKQQKALKEFVESAKAE